MANTKITKHEQQFNELTKKINSVGQGDPERYDTLKKLFEELKTLAFNIGACQLLDFEILSATVEDCLTGLQCHIGALHKNIHIALQTKLMRDSCKKAKWACFWAALAAIAACISVIVMLVLN